jgi:hypothetical protein
MIGKARLTYLQNSNHIYRYLHIVFKMEGGLSRLESPQVQENLGLKRKRSPINDEPPAVRQGPPLPQGGMVTPINYLIKARPEKLKLIEGDAGTFGDVLEMIDNYEGL